LFYVLRHLFERKVRSALSVLGVSVSVAAIVALLSVTLGMRKSVNSYMEESGASLVVMSRGAADLAFSRVQPEQVEAIAALPGVDGVGRAVFTALLAPRLAEGRRGLGPLFVFGRFFEERTMQKYGKSLVRGRLPRAPSEVLFGEYAADRLGVRLGDRLPLFERQHLGIADYEVVGIFRSGIAWENLATVVHGPAVQEELNAGGRVSLLFVYTAPPAAESVRAAIDAGQPDLAALPAGEFASRFAEQMKYIDDFVAIVTVVALVIGVLGVLNTMMMSVSERVREIGTLRALGWSRARVVRVVIHEGVLLSIAGGLLGLGLGYAGTEALLRWFHNRILVAHYEAATFLKAGGVAVGMGLLGAFYPGLKASSLRPVEALRHE
jgi:putative ABC transport system permease protein